MPLPPRRKRCSFGGKEGVWWRRKKPSWTETVPRSIIQNVEGEHHSKDNLNAPLPLDLKSVFQNRAALKWDEDLDRAVYRRSSIANQESSRPLEEGYHPSARSSDDNPGEEDQKSIFRRVNSLDARDGQQNKRLKLSAERSSVLETFSVATTAASLAKTESPGSVSTSSSFGNDWFTQDSNDSANGRSSICILSPRCRPSPCERPESNAISSPFATVANEAS